MSNLIFKEKPLSRAFSESDSPTLDTQWIIGGTDDQDLVRALMAANLPMIWDGLVLQDYGADPLGGGWWEGAARYGKRERKEPGDSSFNFDISAGNVHITHSLATVGAYAASGKTAPNFQGAINVTKDGVDGVDISLPTYTFGETHYLDDSLVTEAYKAALFYATGTVNARAFRGLASGECMFLGASGSKRGREDWEVSFKFAAQPNAVDIPIGPSITVKEKRGWDYLWVYYAEEEDSAAKMIVKRPIAAYVEQVSQYSDFGALAI